MGIKVAQVINQCLPPKGDIRPLELETLIHAFPGSNFYGDWIEIPTFVGSVQDRQRHRRDFGQPVIKKLGVEKELKLGVFPHVEYNFNMLHFLVTASCGDRQHLVFLF